MAVLFKNLPAVWFHVAKMLPSECNDLKQFYMSCFSYLYYNIVSEKYQVSNINLLIKDNLFCIRSSLSHILPVQELRIRKKTTDYIDISCLGWYNEN